jgi:hypothetical protein
MSEWRSANKMVLIINVCALVGFFGVTVLPTFLFRTEFYVTKHIHEVLLTVHHIQ